MEMRAGGTTEVITDDREIVAAIRARLADRVGKDRYDVWFGPGTRISLGNEALVVTVRDRFFQDWLRLHFRKDLEAISAEVVGRPITLEFRIAPPVVEAAAVTLPSATQAAARGPASVCRGNGTGKPPASVVVPRRQYATLESFVVGNASCLAYKTAQIAVEQPGVYSPLLIHGPTGTGKSHLLEGVCAAYRRGRPRAGAVYLSAEQFTTSFLEALHGTGLPSFRRKYRGLELLAIDDLQFFANKKATPGERCHTVDWRLRSGRQVVFAADRPPAQLKALGPDLIARLAGGMICRLDPADYATRLGIVRQLATRLEFEVPQDVETFIASHFTTQSRELAGALKRLQATSLALERPVSLALAEEALAELIDHPGRDVKLADIEKAVCEVFGLTPATLQSAGKAKAVSHPRMLAMFLARKHTRAPLSVIGAYFGRRSHTTVISAQKKVKSWMAGGSAVRLSDRAVSLEETIRRVEERLRAG